jgi:putative SOS response-associated peptidase YedK
MWFAVPEQPTIMVAGFWQMTAKGRSFTMVASNHNPLVAPIHPKAMITILQEADWDPWLRVSHDDVVMLQQPNLADKTTVRGPVFPNRQSETT